MPSDRTLTEHLAPNPASVETSHSIPRTPGIRDGLIIPLNPEEHSTHAPVNTNSQQPVDRNDDVRITMRRPAFDRDGDTIMSEASELREYRGRSFFSRRGRSNAIYEDPNNTSLTQS